MDKLLTKVLIVSVVLITLSISYYFFVLKPKKDSPTSDYYEENLIYDKAQDLEKKNSDCRKKGEAFVDRLPKRYEDAYPMFLESSYNGELDECYVEYYVHERHLIAQLKGKELKEWSADCIKIKELYKNKVVATKSTIGKCTSSISDEEYAKIRNELF